MGRIASAYPLGEDWFMRRIAVILGAGASADAWNETGPPRIQAWQPPLARELFGQRQDFWPILERYPGAHVVSADLAELIRTGAMNIEAKLREYAEHADPRIRNHFRQVPPYLRDLMNAVVLSFTPGGALPGTHLRLVANLLAIQARFAFIDLNYDDYLEMSLAAFDEQLSIRGFDDYTAEGRQAIVAKCTAPYSGGCPWRTRGRCSRCFPGSIPLALEPRRFSTAHERTRVSGPIQSGAFPYIQFSPRRLPARATWT